MNKIIKLAILIIAFFSCSISIAATNTYNLTLIKAGLGSGNIISSPNGINCGKYCVSAYSAKSIVTLTATANSDSTFLGWSGACSGKSKCSVSMTSAKSVTATFAPTTYSLDVIKSGSGMITISSSPSGISCGSTCRAFYNANTTVTLTAKTDNNTIFTGWSGACKGEKDCVISMNSAKSVAATFVSYVKATDSFIKNFSALSSADVIKVLGRTDDNPYYILKDTNKTQLFGFLTDIEYKSINQSDVTNKNGEIISKKEMGSYTGNLIQLSDFKYQRKGVCASFVSAAIDGTLKSPYLKLGKKINPDLYIPKGTVLVTNPRGDIPEPDEQRGHTVIFLQNGEENGKKYIWVLDQNSYFHLKDSNPATGVVGFHRLYFKGGNNPHDLTDAYNYYAEVRVY